MKVQGGRRSFSHEQTKALFVLFVTVLECSLFIILMNRSAHISKICTFGFLIQNLEMPQGRNDAELLVMMSDGPQTVL